jgi:hypothetical protein
MEDKIIRRENLEMLTGQGTTNVDHVMTKNDDTVVLE